jgi:YfiH family protein
MSPIPPLPGGVTRVTEERRGPLGVLVHPAWVDDAWLAQGTTVRGGSRDFDLGLFSDGSAPETVRAHWARLAAETGFPAVVHARQVHGSDVHRVGGARPAPDVPSLLDPADGHVTDQSDVLLAVTTADCVPVFLVDVRRRAVGAVHAGWRGVAAGILENAAEAMSQAFGTRGDELRVHLGPAICGGCYEVGPEVFEALGLPRPVSPTPVDVRAVLADRALRFGILARNVSVSTHCTRCTGSDLYSHRGGDAQRQVGFIGIRRGDAA